MKKIKRYLCAILIIIIGCDQHSNSKTSIATIDEVDSLNSEDQKKVFLEKIYKQDQKVRNDLNEIEIKYGYDSNERKEAIRQSIKVDKQNLQKIELYLEKYGHPSIEKHGEYASRAPWLVIHHSANLESKKKIFTYLYSAYKNEDLKPGSFSFYLERFHRIKFGNRFTLPNPYREDQLIDSLIKRLDLKKLIQ